MQRYAKTKDSGIEWVGPIPAHWSVKPLFALFRERQMPNYGNKEKNVLSLSYGKIIRRDVESNFGLLPESFETYNTIEPENIVLRLTDLQNDKRSLRCGFVGERGIITSAYLTLEKLKGAEVLPAYAYYLLHGYDMRKVFYSMGGGVRQSIKFDDLKRLPILLPPLQEQSQIVEYLDSKIKLLDESVDGNKKLRKLFEEARIGCITQAISGNTRPGDFLDSGVELIPKIPKNWQITKLKYLTRKIGSGVTPRGGATVYLEKGIPILRSQNIHFSEIRLDDVAYISEETHNEMSSTKVLQGDVLLNITGASIGRCNYWRDTSEANVTQHVCIVRPNNLIATKYLYYYLSSSLGQIQIDLNQNGISREGLNHDSLGSFLILLPPLKEQYQIVDSLERQTHYIDTGLKQKQKVAELLGEARSSLVSESVTGKIRL